MPFVKSMFGGSLCLSRINGRFEICNNLLGFTRTEDSGASYNNVTPYVDFSSKPFAKVTSSHTCLLGHRHR